MLEFRKPDKKKTSQAVKSFFKSTYPDLVIKAAVSEVYPKSPNLKEINVQESKKGNSQEKKILEYVESKNLIDGVNIALDAVKKMNDTDAGIVRFTFIGKLPIQEICRKLNITVSSYYRSLDSALTLFAIAFAPWHDLRRWK